MSKKVLLSGIQPSGKPHIGNYFGMMKQLVDMQDEYDCFMMIADYHALHSLRNPKEMRENIIGVLLDFLAIGLDPRKATFFLQSSVSEHTELTWIFDTIITIPYLERAHSYKDAMTKITAVLSKTPSYVKKMGTGVSLMEMDENIDQDIKSKINVGTFNYPVLMASDILLYDTDIVPVGKDQQQHIEITRDIADKFNHMYGETFKLPKDKIVSDLSTEKGSITGIDGYKMSKSRNNTIPLFASNEEIKKLVMSIVTDSGNDGAINVRAIHYPVRKALFAQENKNLNDAELTGLTGKYFKELYEEKAGKYKDLKEALIEDLEKFIAPLREKRKEYEKDIPKALAILKEGGERAKKVASAKMAEVRAKVGVDVY